MNNDEDIWPQMPANPTNPLNPTPAPADPQARQLAAVIGAATAGASLAEIAAALEITEHQLARRYTRHIKKAWGRRAIALRQALTRAGLQGDIQALKRLTDLEWKAINTQRRKESDYGYD